MEVFGRCFSEEKWDIQCVVFQMWETLNETKWKTDESERKALIMRVSEIDKEDARSTEQLEIVGN